VGIADMTDQEFEEWSAERRRKTEEYWRTPLGKMVTGTGLKHNAHIASSLKDGYLDGNINGTLEQIADLMIYRAYVPGLGTTSLFRIAAVTIRWLLKTTPPLEEG